MTKEWPELKSPLGGTYATQDGKFLIDPFPVKRRDYIFDVDPEGRIYAQPDESAHLGIVASHNDDPYETPDGP